MEYLDKPQKQNRLQKILGGIVRKSSPTTIKMLEKVGEAVNKVTGIVDEVQAAREGTKAKNKLLASVELTPEAKKLLKTTAVRSYSEGRYDQKDRGEYKGSDGVFIHNTKDIKVKNSTGPEVLLHELSHADDHKKNFSVEKRLKKLDNIPQSGFKNDIADVLTDNYGIMINPNIPIPRKQRGFKEVGDKILKDPDLTPEEANEYRDNYRRSAGTEGLAHLLSFALPVGLDRAPKDFRISDIVDYDKSPAMSKLKADRVNPVLDLAVNLLQPTATKGKRTVEKSIRGIKRIASKNPLVSAIKSVIK